MMEIVLKKISLYDVTTSKKFSTREVFMTKETHLSEKI